MIEVIYTKDAAEPIAPYSQAIKAGGFIFLSGAAGIDTKTGGTPEGDIAKQTDLALQNLSAVLLASGSSFSKVVKVTVYLKNMADYEAMNQTYRKWWNGHFPARTTISPADLPRQNLLIEIDAIALA